MIFLACCGLKGIPFRSRQRRTVILVLRCFQRSGGMREIRSRNPKCERVGLREGGSSGCDESELRLPATKLGPLRPSAFGFLSDFFRISSFGHELVPLKIARSRHSRHFCLLSFGDRPLHSAPCVPNHLSSSRHWSTLRVPPATNPAGKEFGSITSKAMLMKLSATPTATRWRF